MRQLAQVEKRIDEHSVLVQVSRRGACGQNCASCNACAGLQKITAVAEDPLGVSPGEWVTVESSSGKVLGLSILLYLVPLLAFFLFYCIGTLLWSEDLPQALFACLGFFLGLLAPTVVSRRLKGKIPLTVCSRAEDSGGF